MVVVDHALHAQPALPPAAAAPSIPRWSGHAAKPLRRCRVSKEENRFSVTFSRAVTFSRGAESVLPSLGRVHERMIKPESMLKLGH